MDFRRLVTDYTFSPFVVDYYFRDLVMDYLPMVDNINLSLCKLCISSVTLKRTVIRRIDKNVFYSRLKSPEIWSIDWPQEYKDYALLLAKKQNNLMILVK